MSIFARPNTGTHHEDAMSHIFQVCRNLGFAFTTVVDARGQKYQRANLEKSHVEELPTADRYLFEMESEVAMRRFLRSGPEFALRLNVPEVRTGVAGNLVYVEVPRAGRRGPVLFGEVYQQRPAGQVLLGRLVADDAPLWLDLTKPENPHAALIGTTGSGKTTLARTMALSAWCNGARIALFGPKGDLWPLSGLRGIYGGGLFRKPEACETGLAGLVRRMARVDAGEIQATPMIVFVDEVPTLIAQRPRIKSPLAQLAMAGRHADIHLVLIAQHALVSELGAATMRNLPVRIVGHVTDATAAYQANGAGQSGAQAMRGAGTFTVKGQMFHAAMIPPTWLAGIERRYPPREARAPALPVEAPTTAADLDDVGGRRADEIPGAVIAAIREYRAQEGRWPSGRWIRGQWGYGVEKQKRALGEAQRG